MSSSLAGQVVVSGFSVIPLKFSAKTKSCHHLYIKEHSVRDSDTCKPRDRTLFVLNVPPYCDEESLKHIFSGCGRIQKVFIHKKPTSGPPSQEASKYFSKVQPVTGFKVAYVVFKNAASLKKAKELTFDEPKILSTKEHPIKTGMEKWCEQYRESKTTDVQDLQTEVDKWMADYDRKVEEEKVREKEMEGVPDEDGWVTVGSRGHRKGIPRTEVQQNKITAKHKKKQKEKELVNFYAFQMRQSKREHIAKLRQKFEEDKQRIQLMRAARKFRPY